MRMDYTCNNTTESDHEWYFKVAVASSLGLQILLYFLAPQRKRSNSRSVQGLISSIYFLSNWIPAVTLILISSCVVFTHDRRTCNTTGHSSPLLTWASVMLLHLAGHGQERETPVPLHLGEINETFKVILEFLFYSMIFLTAFFFHFDSWNDETLPETLVLALLACLKTFGKLKHLRNRIQEIKQESTRQMITLHSCPGDSGQVMASNKKKIKLFDNHYLVSLNWGGRSIIIENLENTTNNLDLNPTKASKIAEDELKLTYYKFYGGVAPSEFELLIITVLLSVELSSSPFFIATIFLNNYVILYVILFFISKFKVSLLKVVKETEVPLVSTSLLVLPPLSKSLYITSMDFSDTLMYILIITNHLIAYPIMRTHFFHQVYRNDPYQWPGWSRTIQRFNILTYSLRKPSKILASTHHILSTWPLSGKEQYEDSLGEYLFSKLENIIFCHSDNPQRKLNNVTRQVIAAKGLWVLRQEKHLDLVDCEAPFEERVLLWHVATAILYHTSSNNTRAAFNRNMSMLLSDYMGYLLIVQPRIMPNQRGVVLRRCLQMWAEINVLTKDSEIQDLERICQKIKSQQRRRQSCSRKDQIKTVLQGACELAKKLESTFPDAKQRWRFIVKVWVEKLACAATQCKTINHIQGLSQGGELAGIVWQWMLHFEAISGSAVTKLDPPQPKPIEKITSRS